jgi:thiamine-phosphate pyrophosphorylase
MTPFAKNAVASGLYIILDSSVARNRSLTDILHDATAAGARQFQYRHKSASMKAAYAEALPVRTLARDLGVTFIVNDRCDLALALDADGVHIGQGDLPFADARKVMGPDKLIGLSTHTPEQVRGAELLQPDYIGFGPVFTPASKQDHDPVVGIEGVRLIRSITSLPIFAIGGIQLKQVQAVMQAGADGIAVISAVLAAADVKTAVEELLAQIAQSYRPIV